MADLYQQQQDERPALSDDAQEKRMINLAIQLAEQQLRDGTASAQVITHYLKLGTVQARLEQEILDRQKELIVAKTDALRAQQHNDEMFAQGIAAMKAYRVGFDDDSSDV